MTANFSENRYLSIVLKPADQENMKIIQDSLSDDKAIDAVRFGLQAGAEKMLERKEVQRLLKESRIEYVVEHAIQHITKEQ